MYLQMGTGPFTNPKRAAVTAQSIHSHTKVPARVVGDLGQTEIRLDQRQVPKVLHKWQHAVEIGNFIPHHCSRSTMLKSKVALVPQVERDKATSTTLAAFQNRDRF